MSVMKLGLDGEEMMALNRKREREDKIGKLMGEYLLKGYKMLGSTCSVCGTILLRDRQQQDYCIGCNEIDIKIPVASQTNESTVVNQQLNSNHISPCVTNIIGQIGDASQEVVSKIAPGQQSHLSESCDPHSKKCYEKATLKLQEQISWAASQLGSSNSVEMDVKLSKLIYSCAKALKTLKELQ